MSENLTGLVKIIGISILLVLLWAFLAYQVPENFLKPNNIENLLRRTALFGILGIAMAMPLVAIGRVAIIRFYVEDYLGDDPKLTFSNNRSRVDGA